MKALGCFAVAVVVAVGGFVALVVFFVGRTDDQSALTQRVELVPSDVERKRSPNAGTQYRFQLAYEVGDAWFGDSGSVGADYWDPSLGLSACVDPDDPRQYVVTLRRERCGQESIVAGLIQDAEPTSRPDEATRD